MCWGSSGERPWVVAGAADGGVSVAAVQELAGELVQGCGQVQGDGAQGSWVRSGVRVIWSRVRRAMRASGCP